MGGSTDNCDDTMVESKQWWDDSEGSGCEAEIDCGRRMNIDRFCQARASDAARRLWEFVLLQETCAHGEDGCGISWSALRFGHYFCQTLKTFEKENGNCKEDEITVSAAESDKGSGVDFVDSPVQASPDPDGGLDMVDILGSDSNGLSRRTPSPPSIKRAGVEGPSRRASVPCQFQSKSPVARKNQVDISSTEATPLSSRANSDASQSSKSSFLRRMSFKNLFAKPTSDAKTRHQHVLNRVMTSGDLFTPKDAVDSGSTEAEVAAFTRPRLSSAPASELGRLRPRYTGSATCPCPPSSQLASQPATSSSLFNLPQRLRKNSVTSISGRQSPQLTPSTNLINDVIPEHVPEAKKATETLAGEPWFNSQIGRTQASSQVLLAGGGAYLVRPSESRPGEFVLTFNAHGKPKHIRFNVTSEGRCRVQATWFESVADLLDHYHSHPLPLESDHTPESYLTQCVTGNGQTSPRPASSEESPSLAAAFVPGGQNAPHLSPYTPQRFCRGVSPSSAHVA